MRTMRLNSANANRHTPWAGSANIEDGVTIDTQGLNGITLSPDKKSVSIGPGNKWGEVYKELDEYGLMTSGGRVASVGVGGLILGGGISFYSPRFGLVCDNVINYEMVMADGVISNVNATSNPQLFKALKGGSNNLGVITRFDLKVFEGGNLWGGFLVNPITEQENIFNLFEKFAKSDGYDPYAAMILSVAYTPSRGGWSIASNMEYTKPTPNPPVFQPFTALPQLLSTMRITNMTALSTELDASSPPGGRDLFATATFKNSAKMMNTIVDLANRTVQNFATAQGLVFSLSFQPLPQAVTSPGFATTAGLGNSLGLSIDDGDLVNVLLTVQWRDPANDAVIDSSVKSLFADIEKASRAAATYHPYLYLNYAAPWQKPIDGYGAESVKFLSTVAGKVDPDGVFQKLVTGGFKLGATASTEPDGQILASPLPNVNAASVQPASAQADPRPGR